MNLNERCMKPNTSCVRDGRPCYIFSFLATNLQVKVWITHNEPYDFCVEGYGTGSTGPLVYATGVGEYLCAHHVLLSHAAAYQLYKERYRSQQRGKIGITLSGRYYYPATNVTPYDTVERALLFQVCGLWYRKNRTNHPLH